MARWFLKRKVRHLCQLLIDNMGFDNMPMISLNVMIIRLTTKTLGNVDNQSIIDFYIKENIGDQELREFWVEGSGCHFRVSELLNVQSFVSHVK
ncbi:unnamed protein product [Rhizophagus irregularis]|nr:unnamed protein product [Rhizophagus irregularis]